MMRERHRSSFISIGIFTSFILSWEILARAKLISNLFFPPPSTIFHTITELVESGNLVDNLIATLGHLIIGFIIGGILGIIFGLLMGWSQKLRYIIDPFIAAFHPLPKIALLPLAMVIFGIGDVSKIILIALSAFFPLLINTMIGVRQIDPIYFEVAKDYGQNIKILFTRIIYPASLPFILGGARLAVNTALIITISIELINSSKGLGSMIWLAWQTLRMEELYAALFFIGLIGIAMNGMIIFIERRFLPWKQGYKENFITKTHIDSTVV